MRDPAETLLWDVTCGSEEATLALGRRLGLACAGGEILLVEGPLGAGKTCMANGLADGLGIDEPTASPTFVLMRSYRGRRAIALHHLDFYRLTDSSDVETIGLDDCYADDAVVYIEWPDRCPDAVEAWSLRLRLEPIDETTRRVRAWSGNLPLSAALRELHQEAQPD